MEILWFDELPSTQLYLKEKIKSGKLSAPVAVCSKLQSAGVGSRNNSWDGRGESIFLSFALKLDKLPSDLPIISSSVYFGYLIKEYLTSLGSKVWFKWPNDLYIDDKKIGGIIANLCADTLVCGVGINRKIGTPNYGDLDIKNSHEELILGILNSLDYGRNWKQIFSKLKIEFESNKAKMFSSSVGFLGDSILLEDGSVQINGKRVFSGNE